MAKYHINPETGVPGLCKAEKQCRFGGNEAHYSSSEDARQAFELSMAGQAFTSPFPGHPRNLALFGSQTMSHVKRALSYSYGDLRSYDRTLFYELDAAQVNTDWDNPEQVLATVKLFESARTQMASASDVGSEAGRADRRRASCAGRAAVVLEEHLSQVPFKLLDKDYNADPEGARSRWLSA